MRRLFRSAIRKTAVRENVSVGKNFHVGFGSVLWAPRSLEIGNDVYVGKSVTIEVDGSIGDGTLIANNVGIIGRTDHATDQIGTLIRRSRWVGDFPDELSKPTVIGADVWIGFGAIVLSGVRIGDSSVVAAGAVVVRDVPDNSVVVGSPAHVVASRFSSEEFEEHWARLLNSGVNRSPRVGRS